MELNEEIIKDTKTTYMTLEEVAQHLGVQRETIRQEVINKRLKAFKVGRRWRIKMEDLEEYMKPKNM